MRFFNFRVDVARALRGFAAGSVSNALQSAWAVRQGTRVPDLHHFVFTGCEN